MYMSHNDSNINYILFRLDHPIILILLNHTSKIKMAQFISHSYLKLVKYTVNNLFIFCLSSTSSIDK